MLRSSLLLSLVLPLAACATAPELHVVEAATPAENALLFDQVKALEGTWEMADEQGVRQVASVFTLSSNGSVVREVMYPGQPAEMTNVYHMDGPTLVMTHYCAGGNQPRMRACTAEQGTIAFHFDSVTNLTDPQAQYMGELTLVRVDPDTLLEEWKTMQDGKVVPEHSPVFTLTRKK